MDDTQTDHTPAIETANSWLYEPETTSGNAMDSAPFIARDREAVQRWIKRRRAMDDFLSRRKSLVAYLDPKLVKKIAYGFVNLIKTIDDDHFPYIVEHLVGYFHGKYSREKVVAYLTRCGVSEARAEFIADDQINKLAERLRVERWKTQGISRVRWVHSGYGEPRVYHIHRWDRKSGKKDGKPNGLNGFVFDIDNPPVVDLKSGERGYPGQLIGCRCRLEPVLF